MSGDTKYIWRNQTGTGLDTSICQIDFITLNGIIQASRGEKVITILT